MQHLAFGTILALLTASHRPPHGPIAAGTHAFMHIADGSFEGDSRKWSIRHALVCAPLHGIALAALGLAALAPTAALAQTQDLFVSSPNSNTISRFAGTGTRHLQHDCHNALRPQPERGGLAWPSTHAATCSPQVAAATASRSSPPTGAGTFGAGTTFATGQLATGLNGPRALAVRRARRPVRRQRGTGITRLHRRSFSRPGQTVETIAGANGADGLAFDARNDLFSPLRHPSRRRDGPGTLGPGTNFATAARGRPAGLAFDWRGPSTLAATRHHRVRLDGRGHLRGGYDRRPERADRPGLRRARRPVRQTSNSIGVRRDGRGRVRADLWRPA